MGGVLIYESRVDEAAEGGGDAMRRRFYDNVATRFFPRHGIELLGAFTAPVDDGRLTYMTRFADEDARKNAWASFAADPEWAAGKAAGDEDARLIAGGQTLVPMLAMRLARPAKLIDILRLPELAGIREEAGAVIVGATTRQAQAERDPVIPAPRPLLARVLPWVGHPPTRNRGTVGGSIANADPSAEIPLVAVTLGADIMLATTDGPTSMPADDFFIGPMLTTIGQGECVSAIRFPVWPHQRIGVGFFEISARRSDFAFVAAAAQVALDDAGRCLEVALGVGGVGDRPLRLDVSSLVGPGLDSRAPPSPGTPL